MGDNELIEFLRDLIPYYLEKQRGGLASKILNFHFKSRKGENFHFAVAVLKNLAKVFLEEGDKGFLVCDMIMTFYYELSFVSFVNFVFKLN